MEKSTQPKELPEQILSALIDEEHTEEGPGSDSATILDSVSRDEQSRATWQRYHLIRDVMQRDYVPSLSADFAELVRCQIENEDFGAHSSGSKVVEFGDPVAKRRSWLPIASMGLAASVVVASLVGYQYYGSQDESSVAQTIPTASSMAQVTPAVEDSNMVPTLFLNGQGTHWRTAANSPRDQLVEQRLNSLLTNHLEDAAMGKVHGILSHSRVVSYRPPVTNESF